MSADPFKQYDRMSLILYYLRAKAHSGHTIARYVTAVPEFNDLLRNHYTTVLTGLERLYGVTLAFDAMPRGQRALFTMFEDTAESYLAIRTPWLGYREALYVHMREQPGTLGENLDKCSTMITKLTDELRQTHLKMLDTFVRELLNHQADATFTSDDLRAIRVDDEEPDFDTWAIANPS